MQVLLLLLVAFSIYISPKVAKSWRRAFQTTLANVPGPISCKFTSLTFLCRGVIGTGYLWCLECHNKYGRIFRSGPWEVSITDVDAVRKVLLQDDLPKAPFYAAIRVQRQAPTLLTSVDREDRKRISKATLHSVAGRGLSSLEVTFRGMISDFFDLVDEGLTRSSKTLNVYGQLTNLAMDIIGEVVWGRPFGFLGKDNSIKNLAAIDMSQPTTYKSLDEKAYSIGSVASRDWNKVPAAIYDHIPYLGLATFVPGLNIRPRSSKEAISIVSDASVERFNDAEDGVTPYKGILAEALARSKTSQTFSVDEATNHGAELVVGGTDSVTGVVTAAIDHLLNTPAALRKLQESIDPCSDGLPDDAALKCNEYLRCCIKEAIRLHTPVNFSIRRVPRDVHDYEILNVNLPAGTFVRIPLRSIHRDKEYWPQPDRFWPERWMSDERACEGAPPANEKAFFGFSIGSRVCIGKSYAWTLMRLMLGGFLSRYTIEAVPGQSPKWRSVFVSSLEGGRYDVRIAKRLKLMSKHGKVVGV